MYVLILVTCFIDCHLFLLFLTCLQYVFYIFLYPYGLLFEIKDILLLLYCESSSKNSSEVVYST